MIWDVLDHGFIRVVEKLGDDLAICRAARVSTGKGSKGDEADRKLIRYLWKNKHTSPFEMCEITLHVKLPIFVARQWIRHRTANVNEISGRYCKLPAEFYVPAPDVVRAQSKVNKQGREEGLNEEVVNKFITHHTLVCRDAFNVYNEAINNGVAKELARIMLPVATYTEWYWKIDLRNLLHFLLLRMDSHAQWEIRQYADIIGNEIVARWVPWTWEAFRDAGN